MSESELVTIALEELLDLKARIVDLQHERNELSKAVALANQKIAELEELLKTRERLQHELLSEWEEVNRVRNERISQLEAERTEILGKWDADLELSAKNYAFFAKQIAGLKERIAELEAENHRLQTDIDDLELVNKWSGERLAELEDFVRATSEDEGHLFQEAQALLFSHSVDDYLSQIRNR